MKCKKCDKSFPRIHKVDGKDHHLYNRKYCLECSPFKSHNTKVLEKSITGRACESCNKIITRSSEKGRYCWICSNKINREGKLQVVKKLVGESCWICGYNRCWQALEFHHVYPETKLFQITTRELQFSWDKIEVELRKCALVCACCHREIHKNLISQEKIVETWKDHWENCDSISYHKELKQYRCVDCDKDITNKAIRCESCAGLASRKIERPSKDELAKLLWEKSTKSLAKDYGVSDKAVEKWAKSYSLSKPPRGFWVKKKPV